MTTSVLLDSGYLISLVDKTRPNHLVAAKYYKLLIDQGFPMYLSTIAVSEFEIRQRITELPLRNFRMLPFNVTHAEESARLWNQLGPREEDESRACVRDDVKLIGQANREGIPFLLTEDARTLAKYCERLRSSKDSQVRAVVLKEGFDPNAFRADGQKALNLSHEAEVEEDFGSF